MESACLLGPAIRELGAGSAGQQRAPNLAATCSCRRSQRCTDTAAAPRVHSAEKLGFSASTRSFCKRRA